MEQHDDGAERRAGGKPFAVVFGTTSLLSRHLAARLTGRGFEGWCVRRRGTEPPRRVDGGEMRT